MRKYRGFEREVPTLGNLGFEWLQTKSTRYAPVKIYAAPEPTAQISPLALSPVQMVPIKPPLVTLPPPVPGTGPIDTMRADIMTDDFIPLSPVSIGPTSVRGAGPAGTQAGAGVVIPDESVAFPYATNGTKETMLKKEGQNNAIFWAAIAAMLLLGG